MMLGNSAWAAIFLAVLAAATIVVWRLWPRVMPVVLCHNVVWAGAIAMIGTGLIRYGEASARAWLVLLSGIVAFNVGAVIAAQLRRNVPDPDPNELEERRQAALPLVSRPVFFVLVVLYLIGFAIYLASTIGRFGLETLLTNPIAVRGAKGETYLESVPIVGRALLYVGPVVFVILCFKTAVTRPFPWYVRILGLAIVSATMLALLQRTNLFVSVLWAIAVFITWRVGRRVRDAPESGLLARVRWQARNGVIIPLLAGGAVLLVAFQAVGGALNKNAQQAIESGVVSPALIESGLASPFGYLTGGPVGFLQLVESENFTWPGEAEVGDLMGDNNPQTWGVATFAAVVRFIPGVQQWNEVAPFIDVGEGMVTNVFTWHEPLYRDFREIGVILGMLGIGWLTSWLFLRRFDSPTTFYIQASLFSAIFLAVFVPKYNTNIFIAGVLVVLVLPWFARLERAVARRWSGRTKNSVGTES